MFPDFWRTRFSSPTVKTKKDINCRELMFTFRSRRKKKNVPSQPFFFFYSGLSRLGLNMNRNQSLYRWSDVVFFQVSKRINSKCATLKHASVCCYRAHIFFLVCVLQGGGV